MEQAFAARPRAAIHKGSTGKSKELVWFFRGVRDAVAQVRDSGAAFCPRSCVAHHQSYSAFAAYCRGFHLGCLCSNYPPGR